jgi:hypothetical protein
MRQGGVPLLHNAEATHTLTPYNFNYFVTVLIGKGLSSTCACVRETQASACACVRYASLGYAPGRPRAPIMVGQTAENHP